MMSDFTNIYIIDKIEGHQTHNFTKHATILALSPAAHRMLLLKKIDHLTLDQFINTADAIGFKKIANHNTSVLLNKLDSKYSFEKTFRTNKLYSFKIFSYFFDYHGRFLYTTLLALSKCLNETIRNNRVNTKITILDCDYRLYGLNLYTLITELIPNDLKNNVERKEPLTYKTYKLVSILRLFLHPTFFLKKLHARFRSKFKTSKNNENRGKPGVLLYRPMYNSLPLIKASKAINFLTLPSAKTSKKTNVTNLPINLENNPLEFDSIIDQAFGNILITHVQRNALQWKEEFEEFLSFFEQNMPRGFLVDCPPVLGIAPLLVQFFQDKSLPVFNLQHGNLYSEVFEPWHFHSDFNKCDYFLSYGFNQEDYRRTFPSLPTNNCKIVEIGKITKRPQRLKRKKVDIFFPITNQLPLLEGGIIRILPMDLYKRQSHLLRVLNQLNLKTVIKPFTFPNLDQQPLLEEIKELKNLTLVEDMTIDEFLFSFQPRLTLTEFPTSPFGDVLSEDCDIILIGEPFFPFEEQALSLLKKRLYYCSNEYEAQDLLYRFKDGKLSPKRDTEYYTKYMQPFANPIRQAEDFIANITLRNSSPG